MFVPIVLLYASRPRKVDCRLADPMSKFQGLAQITAAFNWQSSPSSPRYYIDRRLASRNK